MFQVANLESMVKENAYMKQRVKSYELYKLGSIKSTHKQYVYLSFERKRRARRDDDICRTFFLLCLR